jgi:hypothetical protein
MHYKLLNIKNKKPAEYRGLFVFDANLYVLARDSIYGTGVHTSATVDTGISVNYTLFVLFADGVNRAGLITGAAIDAIVINRMGHNFTSL